MKIFRSRWLFTFALLVFFVSSSSALDAVFEERQENDKQIFSLGNEQVKCSVIFKEGKLSSDRLEAQPEWLAEYGTRPFSIETDADFGLNVMWTGWRAPGNVNNAENPVMLSKHNFQLLRHEVQEPSGDSKELNLFFKGLNSSLEMRITYRLEKEAFYVRRKIAVRDSRSGRHFLRWVWPCRGLVFGNVTVLKSGGFGQPLALQYKQGGAFFGLEYPTSENSLKPVEEGKTTLHCGQELGERIGNSWIESEWVVEGLSPNLHVKLWFLKYLDRIRVAPLKPFLLYNSWYDVRAPEIAESPAHIMNEKSLLRIIESFKKEMVEKQGLKLDAFVLDDGWDVYKSDWVLSKEQFPRGLAPVSDALKGIGTNLGIWFGPIGGYSNRGWRVEWMRDHGYEVIPGREAARDQLCLAGKRYRQLFKKRVLDFVRDHGMGYYKWDGIQFSCSEPDHGHPVGIYSRRAVMESVIDLCQSVRAENPNIFLNVTSGTWLSPWWVKYANTIWMQGSDYGYANVPSISRRDGAITYRDYVLFEDYGKNDFWFPIANLMTHGIIKGNLQKLGGEAEPLDKFTDNALLYFARGVSMWELYVSPDLLTDGEWNALAKSIRWARDRFDVLRSTEMIGGDPGESLAYGYVHFAGKRGIIAARNPSIEPQTLKASLSPSMGLDPKASSLVVERVYPTRWISPKLYKAGMNLEIPLHGYETAVYEIYPLKDASEPLLAGVTFEVLQESASKYTVRFYNAGRGARLLNPEMVRTVKYGGKSIRPNKFLIPAKLFSKTVSHESVQLSPQENQPEIDIKFDLHKPAEEATLAVLLEPAGESMGEREPEVSAFLDGEKVELKVEQQKGRWGWYTFKVRPGKHTSRIIIEENGEEENGARPHFSHVIISQEEKENGWTGKVSVWLVCSQRPDGMDTSFDLAHKLARRRPMPPRPWPSGELRRTVKLGELEIPTPSK
ncbi:MAG: hypothetical protein E3J44_03580 [Candidatus Aminicenantes bacterium]|nr:MAG: hypothetical protein E3J44_03580 [Candidatus Aminicenantes bacterium]